MRNPDSIKVWGLFRHSPKFTLHDAVLRSGVPHIRCRHILNDFVASGRLVRINATTFRASGVIS